MDYEICQQNNLFFIRKKVELRSSRSIKRYYTYLTQLGTWSEEFSEAARSSSAEEIENYLIKVVKTIKL